MAKPNPSFSLLPGQYLFSETASRIRRHEASAPTRPVIRLGIGDVTCPLVPAVVRAMHAACDEMAADASFRGYGPDHGYPFLREAIAEHDYRARGVEVSADEVFVSDGAKSDTGCIGEIFAEDSRVAVCDPVYPVYVDSAVMAGRAGHLLPDGHWSGIVTLPCRADNGFVPLPPTEGPIPDLIFLCFPNNPTGAVIGREDLTTWVEYARRHGSVILYDAAYEAYTATPGIPRSIYEIPGARSCAIEFKSFSKTAGFTGVRCAYTVIPRELERDGVSLHALWSRRQATRFNGVSYITQRGAAAVYTPEGREQTGAIVRHYMENARIIREGLVDAGFAVYGGIDAPYVWIQTPDSTPSWTFFDRLLEVAGVAGTPGAGFGPAGEGYFRLTAFATRIDTEAAVERIRLAAETLRRP